MSRKPQNPRSPTPIDKRIGQRIKQFRSERGVAQERLAEKLGITFQQVQKYEGASNRVSASRLYEIAAILDKPIEQFFV